MDTDIPPTKLHELDSWIAKKEDSVEFLKPEAKASVNWADLNNKSKTSFSILYLHGFKASKGEGDPVHKEVAQTLGLNLFLSRIYKHGLNNPDAFRNLESKDLTSSAEEALQIAKKLGNKVIIMGTSTGASLGLYLASKKENRDIIAALLLYSPLIKFYGVQNLLLSKKVGRSFLKFFTPRDYRLKSQNQTEDQEKIWYSTYHIDGAFALGRFVEDNMKKETFEKVSCPVFTAYYYKNIFNQDKVVSVKAIKKMHEQLGTDPNQKELLKLPHADSHIISCELVSKSTTELKKNSIQFLRKQLALKQL
ncbi:MAG: hypothetical protein U5J95_08515 [Balneolaceae bacterium]|nr:hypothetical protein [Balneolaceae bacterium]